MNDAIFLTPANGQVEWSEDRVLSEDMVYLRQSSVVRFLKDELAEVSKQDDKTKYFVGYSAALNAVLFKVENEIGEPDEEPVYCDGCGTIDDLTAVSAEAKLCESCNAAHENEIMMHECATDDPLAWA